MHCKWSKLASPNHCFGMLAQAGQYGRRIRRKVPSWLIELGPEKTDGVSEVYLLTFARVLAQRLQRGDLKDVTQMSKAVSLRSHSARITWQSGCVKGLLPLTLGLCSHVLS